VNIMTTHKKMIKEIDPIFAVKNEQELVEFLQDEKDVTEISRLKKQKNGMARVVLAHKFGEEGADGCPCNNCA